MSASRIASSLIQWITAKELGDSGEATAFGPFVVPSGLRGSA